MHGYFKATAVKAFAYSSPIYTRALALHNTRITLMTLGTCIKSLSAFDPPPRQHFPQHFEGDGKRMSKHAVADLGQRAQTLAPAVESGGEEAEQNGEFAQRATGSHRLSSGSYWYLVPQSPGTPNPRCHHPLPQWSSTRQSYFLNSARKDEPDFSRLLSVKTNTPQKRGQVQPVRSLTEWTKRTHSFLTLGPPLVPAQTTSTRQKGGWPGALSNIRQTLRG